MSNRRKISIDITKEYQRVAYANWLAQLAAMILTRDMTLILGRGSAKTTEFQVERLLAMVYDMPGAPVCWVADTYSNLQKNVLPMVLEGLERKGYFDGVHYVIEKVPPKFTDQEKINIPDSIKEHFWKPYNKMVSYKHTIVFFSGLNITFGSLDRPSSLAGKSYVHVFGDEVKYFPEAKIANLLKAVRGYRVQYGNSPFYRGTTFTTDMPNINNVGEYDWVTKQSKNMDKDAIMLLIKTAMIVNECRQEWIATKERGDIDTTAAKFKTLQRWEFRLYALRCWPKAHKFFFVASSYVNVDILTPQWFDDAFASDLGDVRTAILSMSASLESGERFYANITDRHFYRDGSDPYFADKFGLKDDEDCRILRYLDKSKAVDVSIDFGNMFSLLIAQHHSQDNKYRVLKDLYTLSPEWTRELADKYIKYFAHHENKVINLYYDRAGNNYNAAKQDLASKIKHDIEFDLAGKRTGWTVVLMSIGAGNIYQNEEYAFMAEMFGANNPRLPKVEIDFYNCKHLRLSLQLARTRVKDGLVSKDKRSEKLPLARLPLESTNMSDAFKYLVMRPKWRDAAKKRSGGSIIEIAVH